MQQPKRFQAPTLAEAYDQVRRDLGDAAVILSTRKAFAPGLFGQPGRQFVEVVARIPEPAVSTARAIEDTPRPTLEQDVAAHDLVRAVAEATAAAPEAARGPFAGFQRVASLQDLPAPARATVGDADDDDVEDREPDAMPAPTSMRALSSIPGGTTPAAEPWTRQLDQMRGMLEQLLSERLDARMEASPAVVRSMHERLVRHGLPAALASAVLAEAGPRHADEDALAAAVERRLAAKLPPSVAVDTSRRRATFLVGPSGAGKTTLAVRLALQMQREGLNVVIAGTDVNRAGAPQQLLAFGAATDLQVRLCYAPDELAEVLADAEVDAVIVDTPGHNGARRDRMAELDAFLQAARQRTVLLAVPATMKPSDLSDTVAGFSAAGLDGLVLTRCDETAHFGALAGVAAEASVGVAYTTHSEQASDPAAAGDNLALASAVVRAAWAPAAEAAPAPAVKARATSSRRRLARVG